MDREGWLEGALYQLLWLCLFFLIAWSLVVVVAITLHYRELLFRYDRLYQNPLGPTMALVFSWALAFMALVSWVASIALLSWVWVVGVMQVAFIQGHLQVWRQRFRTLSNRFSSTKSSNPPVASV